MELKLVDNCNYCTEYLLFKCPRSYSRKRCEHTLVHYFLTYEQQVKRIQNKNGYCRYRSNIIYS